MEITATDHINKKLLSVFKEHVETGNVQLIDGEDQTAGVDPSEWDDDKGTKKKKYPIFLWINFSCKHKDYTNNLPGVSGQIITSDPDPEEKQESLKKDEGKA